nr:hypothetical protein [Pseudoalteromonas luteoviolacea]
MDTALAGKANQSSVDSALALKANKTDLDTAVTNVVRFDPAKLVWDVANSYKAGEVARVNFTGNMYIALKDVPNSLDIKPTTHPEYWALFVEGNAPKSVKVVFATSQVFDGNLGDRSGADAKCQAAADASSVAPAGTYKALLNVSASLASSYISPSHTYYRVDGQIVAQGSSFFDPSATLSLPIDLDENGNQVGGNAWTNMTPAGGDDKWNACEYFSSTSTPIWDKYSVNVGARVGHIGATDVAWRSSSTYLTCNSTARLYCAQQ